MSKNYAFKAAKRDRAGKGAARALRREGLVPAVIYGDKKEPLNISIPANDINVEYNKGHMFTTICDLEVDGTKHMVLARDVQLHPVKDTVVHADFLRVTEKTKIAVNVPVKLINEDKSPGLREGGVLSVVRYEIELVCSAMDIPEEIEVNLEGKEMGDTAKISDATLPEGVQPVIQDRDFSIANISAPKVIEEVEETPEEGEEGAEGVEGEAAEGGEAKEGAEGGEEKKAEGGDDAKKDE